MKLKRTFGIWGFFLANLVLAENVLAFGGRLSPRDFNKMYYLASTGRVGILREAVGRGLNIDAVNPNGDTGLCIAVKRKNYRAYNSFRMSGANPRHACTYRIYDEYQTFLQDSDAAKTGKIVGNKESLYYDGGELILWPWLLGGAAGAALAFGGGSGGSGGVGETPTSTMQYGDGLASVVFNTKSTVNGVGAENISDVFYQNPNAEQYLDKIKFLPEVLDNADYLSSYVTVSGGGYFNNLKNADLMVGDATIAVAVKGEGSNGLNNGRIDVEAKNGGFGMVVSNGGTATNNPEGTSDGVNGSISMVFKGGVEDDTVIGMYADTNSKIVNRGVIDGVTSEAPFIPEKDTKTDQKEVNGDIVFPEFGESGEGEPQPEEPKAPLVNAGKMVGMAIFDLYTGKDLSMNTVTADNYGTISLSAGYNTAKDLAVSLVGMGSYIDDEFLNGKNNPNYAEKMKLNNYGNINMAYQGGYAIDAESLKKGKGGLIGMRVDSATEGLNRGNINIDLTSIEKQANRDLAAGMLSVHGGKLVNGDFANPYDGKAENTTGTIRITNEGSLAGISYGMLAAKGDGLQTRVYLDDPKLENYGLVDMQTSNSYAMASFAGGEIINNGVINLGYERGQSRYHDNYGLYAAGEDKTKEVSLVNKGIINVFSEKSYAIYNAFSGSVKMSNEGTIYLSNKATDSKVFGGQYSSAYNNGDIIYRVGNSDSLKVPEGGEKSQIHLEIQNSAIGVSSGENTTKQFFENNGNLVIGEEFNENEDYGGTYVTAGVQVSKQGSAVNKANIHLKKYLSDSSQYNVGMYLDKTTTAESYITNNGDITVDSRKSSGMRNDSDKKAKAINLGSIYVKGEKSVGMVSTTINSDLFNGLDVSPAGSVNSIYVMGKDSIGMEIAGTGYNYGNIYLKNDGAQAYVLIGEDAVLNNYGQIFSDPTIKGAIYYTVRDGARMTFDYPDGIEIENFTLGKAEQGGKLYFSDKSTAYVKGVSSVALSAEGKNSLVQSMGQINVSVGATGMQAIEGSEAQIFGEINVESEGAIGVEAVGGNVQVGYGGQVNATNGAIGIKANSSPTIVSLVHNASLMKVDSGIAIHASGRTTLGGDRTQVINDKFATIDISGKGSKGVYLEDGASFRNNENGIIKVHSDPTCKDGGCLEKDYVYGVYANGAEVVNDGDISGDGGEGTVGLYVEKYASTVTNDGKGHLRNFNYGMIIEDKGRGFNSGYIQDNTVGVKVKDGIFQNNGVINKNIKGVVVEGGNFNNFSEISGNGIGVHVLGGDTQNSKDIFLNQIGVLVEKGFFSNRGSIKARSDSYGLQLNGGSAVNQGSIESNGGLAVYLSGKSEFSNEGEISVKGGAGITVGANGARGINNGDIIVNGGSGIKVVGEGSEGINNGSIIVDGGYGFDIVGNKAYGVNNGEISVNNGTAFRVSGQGAKGENKGVLNISEKSSTSILENGGEFVNNGVINDENIGSLSIKSDGKLINKGLLNYGQNEVDFDIVTNNRSGNIVVGQKGEFAAESFKGEVVAGHDITLGGFEDKYVNSESFKGKNEGLEVRSDSYMFDASLKTEDDVTDVELNRKNFEELIEDERVAEFFETNYQLKNNEKMFNSLKTANSKEAFDEVKDTEIGKKFYANINRENMAVLRGINSLEQNRILNEGVKGKFIGADYYRTGKDGTDGLSGYEDDIYSAYLSGGDKLNKNWSMGGTLRLSYADAEYDDVQSSRNNKVLMALLPIIYENKGFKFLTMPEVGVGYGTYKRHAVSGNYEADTLDFYYGLYNHAEYSIDMKVAELVTEAELNVQGMYMSEADEDDGLKLRKNDSVSVEAGVGLKLRRKFQLAKNRSLMLAVGTKYYQELADPYDDVKVGMSGSPLDLSLDGYNEDKTRMKTTIEALYKNDDLSVGAEVSHNAEKDSNIEGGIGVRYHF